MPNDEERDALSRWASAGVEEHRLVERVRVILLAEKGISTREVARRFDTRPARYRNGGNGLPGRASRGWATPRQESPSPMIKGPRSESCACSAQRLPPIEWPLVGACPKDVSPDQVWRILPKHKVQLQILWLYICIRRNMPRWYVWMKNRTSKCWSEPKVGCACPMAKRSTDSATAISATARPACLQLWRWPRPSASGILSAKSSPAVPGFHEWGGRGPQGQSTTHDFGQSE
jgi:hypothetical protein